MSASMSRWTRRWLVAASPAETSAGRSSATRGELLPLHSERTPHRLPDACRRHVGVGNGCGEHPEPDVAPLLLDVLHQGAGLLVGQGDLAVAAATRHVLLRERLHQRQRETLRPHVSSQFPVAVLALDCHGEALGQELGLVPADAEVAGVAVRQLVPERGPRECGVADETRCDQVDPSPAREGADHVFRSVGGGDAHGLPGGAAHVDHHLLVEFLRRRLQMEPPRDDVGFRVPGGDALGKVSVPCVRDDRQVVTRQGDRT